MKKRIIAEAALAVGGTLIGQQGLEAQQRREPSKIEAPAPDSQIAPIMKRIEDLEARLKLPPSQAGVKNLNEAGKLSDDRRAAYVQVLEAVQKLFGQDLDNPNLSGNRAGVIRAKLKKLGISSEWAHRCLSAVSDGKPTSESASHTAHAAKLSAFMIEGPEPLRQGKDPFFDK